MVLSLAVLTSLIDRRFSAQAMELELSEQRYRQLVESAQVILWRRNIQTSQFSYVNQEAQLSSGTRLDNGWPSLRSGRITFTRKIVPW